MEGFPFDAQAVRAACARAERVAASPAVAGLLRRARAGAALGDEDLAALFLAPEVPTATLFDVARDRRAAAGSPLETFSPLYLTNECDAECRMCGMRRTNADLARETASERTAREQLAILHRRGLRAVALLTGEYRHGARRRSMIGRAAESLRAALELGFAHVLINIGALDADEYPLLLDGVARDDGGRVRPQVTMCTFQETYDPDVYGKFMGRSADNPRADFARRLTNFDRAHAGGLWSANPGILLGLNADLGYELLALLAHVRHLLAHDMVVYVSLPRLRRAQGTAYQAGPSDDALVRIVSVLSFGVPRARVVISTREPAALQRTLVPIIGVLTPGSPGVAPYTASGARFELEASQFEVLDHRPIEAILGEHLAAGTAIACYEPAS